MRLRGRVGAGIAILLSVLATAAAAQPETVVVTGRPDTTDPCLVVAGAKVAQWTQTPLLIRETKTFGDGTAKSSEAIFTVNQAYAHYVGRLWHTAQILVPERSIKSPEIAAKKMRLDACSLVGAADVNGVPAHLYTFRYLPDADGSVSEGRIWIGDATGLPLRQELYLNAAHPDPQKPVQISAVYVYGDTVTVPSGAQLAEYDRRSRTQQWVKAMQEGRGYVGQ
jgi:hypothetical protein